VRDRSAADNDVVGYLARVSGSRLYVGWRNAPRSAENEQEAIASGIEAAKQWKQELPNRSMEKSIE
jgi:hypothetical protein